jgi:hypothetical protein
MWKPPKIEPAPMFVEYYKGVKISTHKGGWILNDNTRGHHWTQLTEVYCFINSLTFKISLDTEK